MRNLFYVLLFFGCIVSFCACEREYLNPGDFSVKPNLTVTGIQTRGGKQLPFKILRAIDTTYMRSYIRKDTLKDTSGKPILDQNGKLQIKDVTVPYVGKITGKFSEVEIVVLEARADTLDIRLTSNSKWNAPTPAAGNQAAWFFSLLVAGGGDATVSARTVKNTANSRRLVNANLYIYTPDSLEMYKLVFNQKAANE